MSFIIALVMVLGTLSSSLFNDVYSNQSLEEEHNASNSPFWMTGSGSIKESWINNTSHGYPHYTWPSNSSYGNNYNFTFMHGDIMRGGMNISHLDPNSNYAVNWYVNSSVVHVWSVEYHDNNAPVMNTSMYVGMGTGEYGGQFTPTGNGQYWTPEFTVYSNASASTEYCINYQLTNNSGFMHITGNCFTVANSSFNSGGNNNNCGSDANLSELELFIDEPVNGWVVGDAFDARLETYCNLVGEHKKVHGYVEDPSNQVFYFSYEYNTTANYPPNGTSVLMLSNSWALQNFQSLALGTHYVYAEFDFLADDGTWTHLDWSSGNFTVSSNNSGGNNNTGCTPEVVINSYNPTNANGFENQTTFNSNEPITLYAYHHCFPTGSYHWNSTVYGPSGMYEDNYGNLNTTNNSWLTNVWEYNVGYLGPGEYTWYYGFTNWGDISTYLWHNFTIVNSSSNSGGNGNAGCNPEVVINSYNPTNPSGFVNQSDFYSDDDVYLYAYHYCFPSGNYHWNSTVYGPNGWYDYDYGNMNVTNNSWWTDVWEYFGGELPPGEYTWYYGFTNWGDISRYVSHNFTVIDNGTGTNVTGSCSFPSFEATPYALYAGDDLTYNWTMTGDISSHVYLSLHSGWGTQYYYSGIVVNDGSHTITLPSQLNPNLDYTVYVESAFQDGRTTLCWKYGAIDILGSNEGPMGNNTTIAPTVDLTPRISMWFGKVNQHNDAGMWMTDPDGVAGAGSYDDWGDEGWGDRKLEYCQRFWPDTVDVVLRDSPEEIVFYTRYNTDAYLSTKPVWECVLESAQVPELTGVCSFNLTITPTELEVGDTLTVTWTMAGDIPIEVGIAFFSTVQGQWNVGVQYHLSEITANDGGFAYTIPQGMNPDRDYYMYIDAELTDDFTTYCWKYGSFDILASNEGALEEVLENLFNSTDRTPRISMWYGKVNQHNENGTWMTDPDGTAGAGNFNQFGSDGWGDRKLEYCQRFWPDTVSVAPMGAEQIVFYTRGNQVAYLTTKPVWQCVQDTDGDGILDPDDADDDGDGWSDILEQACGTNELDVNDVPADSDGDQICDLLDDALDEVITDSSEEDAGFLPGFSAIGGLAALGAAMLIGRRRSD